MFPIQFVRASSMIWRDKCERGKWHKQIKEGEKVYVYVRRLLRVPIIIIISRFLPENKPFSSVFHEKVTKRVSISHSSPRQKFYIIISFQSRIGIFSVDSNEKDRSSKTVRALRYGGRRKEGTKGRKGGKSSSYLTLSRLNLSCVPRHRRSNHVRNN